jgi:hypothetical protein
MRGRGLDSVKMYGVVAGGAQRWARIGWIVGIIQHYYP